MKYWLPIHSQEFGQDTIKGVLFLRRLVTQTRSDADSLSFSFFFSVPLFLSHWQQPRDNNANYKRGRREGDVIFKNASIPFTCRPFSESAILRRVARMRFFRMSAVLFPIHFSPSLNHFDVSPPFPFSLLLAFRRGSDARMRRKFAFFILDARQAELFASKFYWFEHVYHLKDDKRHRIECLLTNNKHVRWKCRSS